MAAVGKDRFLWYWHLRTAYLEQSGDGRFKVFIYCNEVPTPIRWFPIYTDLRIIRHELLDAGYRIDAWAGEVYGV